MIGFGYLSYGQAEQIPAAITGGLFFTYGTVGAIMIDPLPGYRYAR